MTAGPDDLARATAQRIERDHPGWLILWGYHSRLYWAFPRFQAPPGTIVAAPDAAELTTRMQHAELAASAHRPPPRQPRRGTDR